MTPALIILLVVGLALRFAIAFWLFPQSGFSSDLSSYVAWANTLAQHGPGGFYANAGFADYPPGYLYLLWPIGLIAQAGGLGLASQDLIKIPPILIDAAVALALYLIVLGWARPRGRGFAGRAALAAAAIYLFNPVTWYDSALWGQTDAAGALVILLGVAALIRGNSEGAATLAVVAAMVKPQFGVVLIPLVGVVLLKRHLFDPGSGPIHRPVVGGRIGSWLADNQGPVRIATCFLIAWAVFFAMAIPFGMGPYEYLTFISKTASGYPYLTVNGYNFWALVGSGGNGSLASDGVWSRDNIALLGPIPGVVIGAALLIVGFLVALWTAFRRDDRPTIVVAAIVLCAAFFVLPTRVHERYLFPVFVLLPILAVWSRRWRWATLAFAIGSFMNLHAILTNANPKYGTDNVASLPFGDLFRTFPFVGLAVMLQTGAFLFAIWQLRRQHDDVAELVETPVQRQDALVPFPSQAPPLPAAPGSPVPTAWGAQPYAAAAPLTVGPPFADADLSSAEAQAGAEAAELTAAEGAAALAAEPEEVPASEWPGLGTWIDGKLGTLRPVRRDRSAELNAEPYGRLDRFDALILVLLTVGSLVLRAWHLDQPRDMYFDEVYHARTATEFLQDWRYGIVHSIYEYTHPHVAKYAMALGIEAFGDNKVVSTTQLDGQVADAALEPRWSPPSRPAERDGDRLYVVNDSGIEVYDLATRQQITTIPLDKPATAVAIDTDGHQLYVATNDGTVSELDTTALDDLRTDASTEISAPVSLLTISGVTGSVEQLVVVDDRLIARTSDGWLVGVDPANAQQTATMRVPGAVKAVGVPATERVVVDQTKVTNLEGEASELATALADDASRIRPLLQGQGTGVAIAGYLSDTDRSAVQKAIDAGKLPGVTIESGPVVAVSDSQGVSYLDAGSLQSLTRITLEGAAGMALVDRGFDNPILYVAANGKGGPQLVPVNMNDNGPSAGQALSMPGLVSDVVWNEPTNLVHVVGQTPDGKPTIYVVEPHANAVFADAQLPFVPVAELADTQRDRPESDRMDILALSADGNLAVVDIGQNTFAWRFPGVIMGTVTLVCIYLLARFLFRRRSVALFGAALGLVGGMFFANARIAMNDTYVAGFMMAALTLFVPLYLGLWRRRWQVILGLLAVGILLGLALASKWVGAYTIGGIVLLVLLRSVLGRIIALLGMVGLTAVLGALAVRAPDVPQPHVNVFFLGLMLVLTVALAVAMVRRPVRMTMAELRFAVFAPAVAGMALIAGSLAFGSQLPETGFFSARYVSLAGAAALLVSAGAYAVAWLAARRGRGPLARRRIVPPDEPVPSPAPTGWLLPGHAGGIPWLYAIVCFSVVPILVYIASYIPWFNLGNELVAGIPAGHTGQTLWQLTLSMYDYHNNLRAGHPASSPWWAWLLDLKPVWFYQEGFANNTTGVIYDAENLVIVWLGIPAMLFASWAAWRRRSLALTVVVLMFLVMWIPWSRVDRATFQYHVFTSLPFLVMALAYFLAELWQGPSPGVWLWARFAAAAAILGPPLLWLGRAPLCIIAGSAAAHTAENSSQGIACGSITRSTDVSQAAVVSVVILLVGAVVLGWQLWLVYRSGGRTEPLRVAGLRIPVEAAPYLTLVAIIAIVVVVPRIFSPNPLFTLNVSADELALIGLVVLAIPAYLVLRARDSRRFGLGIMTAAVLWFVAWYPNLSGLPMPNSIAHLLFGTYVLPFEVVSVLLLAAVIGGVFLAKREDGPVEEGLDLTNPPADPPLPVRRSLGSTGASVSSSTAHRAEDQ